MRLFLCRIAQGNSLKGFTLLELAITMAIIGMLTVSVVGLYAAVAKRQREVKTRKEMENIREAVLGYFENNLVLPEHDTGYVVPIDDLDLPPSAQADKIYAGKSYAYIATNNGDPFSELQVDGQSIGNTAMVLISGGVNLKFDESNGDLSDGVYTQDGTTADFDDILICLSANELASAFAWTRVIEEEVAVLNLAAEILAENDDDGDGLVDEDGGEGNCPPEDVTGNCDASTDWNLVTGVQSLVNAGLISDPDHVVDPWGAGYCWDSFNHEFYSAGPNKTDEGCAGDDICP
jgi:prepilin-type N-terminal cleavage/methylation domain-containing protein